MRYLVERAMGTVISRWRDDAERNVKKLFLQDV